MPRGWPVHRARTRFPVSFARQWRLPLTADLLRPGRYRHFKGNEYLVVGVATHSETQEPMVVYRPLYGDGGLFVRPLTMFVESVNRDGVGRPRFEWVADE